MAGKFEVYQDKADEFRFRLKAQNGEIILSGQGYKSLANCLKGVHSIQANCTNPGRYDLMRSKDGKSYFVLKAANHKIIGQSQRYSSAGACEAGVKSVGNNAPGATIVETLQHLLQ
ncbi:MAG: YegP family protein [Pseudomonadales bacterium]